MFLLVFLKPCKQSLTDDQRGIPIGISSHSTVRAKGQRRPRRVAFCGVFGVVACDEAMTTGAFFAGIAGAHTTRDDPLAPGFVLRVFEDASLHLVCPFRVTSTAVFALLWCEIAEVLKDEDTRPVLCSKLHDTRTDQMSHLLVHLSDLCPQSCVILLALSQNTGLAPVACNTSKLLLPKAVYRFASTYECGGKGRTFSILDGTHGEMMIEIEIDGADARLSRCELLHHLCRAGEGLFDRRMQVPPRSMTNQ